ncbi:serine/threonine-protein kinase [Flindersiella endophytica]
MHGEAQDVASATVELLRLDGYVLRERVGEGGMGVVYKADDPHGRTVAIKLMKPHIAADPEIRRRFAREARVLSRVRGNHIAEVLDADVLAETPYVVTRYVNGPALYDVITHGGPLRGGDLADLAGDLADALNSIHGAGIVHRDLKPGNVLIQDGIAVVIDFGIAQFVDETRWTRTGMVYGTPGYVSPEVLSGGDVSAAADIHAWAATVAFAATGHSPFGSGPLEAVAYRVLHDEPRLDDCPPWLRPVIERCLSKDPAVRPNAKELLDWLELGKVPPPPAINLGTPAGAVPPSDSSPTRQEPSAYDSPGLEAPVGYPQAVAYAPPLPQEQPQAYPQPPYEQPFNQPPYHQQLPYNGAPYDGHGHQQPGPATAAMPLDDTAEAPPVEPPPDTKPRWTMWHAISVGALFVALGGFGGVVPIVALAAMLGWLVLARTVDRAGRHVEARRDRRGGRTKSDSLVAVTTLPWHALRGGLLTALTAPVMLIGAVCLVGLAALLAYAGVLPRRLDAYLALAMLCTAVLAWWGIDGGSVRDGSRRIIRWAMPNTTMLVVGVFVSVVLAMLALTAFNSEGAIYWWPLSEDMLPNLPEPLDQILNHWDR